MITLYDYYRSSACYRVRIALNLKGIVYETIPVHLLHGEQLSNDYKKINPQQLIPTLIDGEHVLTQSLSIIEYLEERYPSPALMPNPAKDRAYVKSLALIIISDLHPLNNVRVLNYLTKELNMKEEQKTAWYQHWMAKGLEAFESLLSTFNLYGDCCYGNEPTLADVCLVPQLYNARRFKCDLTSYPILSKIDKHCQPLQAFSKAYPADVNNEVKI